MIYSDIKDIYIQRKARSESILFRLKKNLLYVSLLRLLAFTGGVVLSVFAFRSGPVLGVFAVLSALIIFLYLVKLSGRYVRDISFSQNLIKINSSELKAFEGDYSDFDGAGDLNNPDHDFAVDIDLFGSDSLFRYMNRTVTGKGKISLSEWLAEPYKLKEIILLRQEAVVELSGKLEWRQQFLANGTEKPLSDDDIKSLLEWIKGNDAVDFPLLLKVLFYFLPSAAIALVIPAIAGLVPFSVFTPVFILNLFLVGFYLRKTNRIHEMVSRKHLFLSSFGDLIESFQKEQFNSSLLIKIKDQLCGDNHSALKEIQQLNRIISAFDNRLNMIAGVLLNGLLLWDFHCIMRLEKWRKSEARYLPVWMKSIGEVDGFVSMANFAFNNPEFSYPQPSDKGPFIEATALGHPLLRKEIRVANNFSVPEQKMIYIITGANMAGKSTFLRCVAVNLVLAMIGAPVCAANMRFRPVNLFTSMRTVDSLSANESYFYAELKRLRLLKERLQKCEEIFFILDEILKGTNSTDKSLGSKLFLRRMIDLGGTGMIATHDISIGEMENEFPENIVNKCFEIEINGEEIMFDYILRDGITSRMNAAVLMRQMGIT